MNALTLQQAAGIVGGTADALPPRTVARVGTDTRRVEAGDLFVALRGERFDAHDFLDQAKHAAAAIVERVPADAPPDLPLIVVPDARRALGDLARHHRRSLTNTTVIAVAGSNGKTGTKRLIHAALSGTLRGTASPASFNNDVGVPLTLLPVDPADDYVVVECGTNAPGEIAYLSGVCRPDVAVITSIGEEHLEGLGDLDGVRRENAAITAGMDAGGVLFINGDDAGLRDACGDFAGKILTFGSDPTNDLPVSGVACDAGGTRFTLAGRPWRVPLLGRHNAANAAAATAVARHLGVSDDAIAAGLAIVEPPPMRMQVRQVGGITVVNDAYNANPASMAAALATLCDLRPEAAAAAADPTRSAAAAAASTDGRSVAVLGDMLELGDRAEHYHREVGGHLEDVGLLARVGPLAAGIDAACETLTYPDAAAAAADLPRHLRPGDVVLLKASRGVRLEVVADAIADYADRHA